MRTALPRGRRAAAGAALLLALLAGCHRLPRPGAPSGQVVRVLDGDTIEVLMGGRTVRVRLHGVDCPERGQAFGTAARRFTAELCFRRTVGLRSYQTDRYGRLLADVVLPDGRVLNHELLRAGLAWWYRQYAPADATLAALEAEARAARRGLWAEADPLPPWEYRAGRRGAGRSRTQAGR